MKNIRRYALLILVFVTTGCAREIQDTTFSATREILPNGAVSLHYSNLSDGRNITVRSDLQIGVMDGEPEYIFGDIRGIEAGRDGTIYVLDAQASEVRSFDADGRFIRIVAPKGEGPGEISGANGMIMVSDSILWIQDHAKWRMVGVNPLGIELSTLPMHILSYGYIYSGTVDNSGRFWKSHSQSRTPNTFPPNEGLGTGSAEGYLISFDPQSDTRDSLSLGRTEYRTFVSKTARGGYRHYRIPYDPRVSVHVDPDGGFWQMEDHTYRIARLNARGDTVLVIKVEVDPIPVTRKDRQTYVDALVERSPDQRSAGEAVAALMSEFKPVIKDLVIDDVGRIWVMRLNKDGDLGTEGETPRFDIFDHDGAYQGSVTLDFNIAPYLPIRVRNDRIYALSVDSLGVPSVVRTPPIRLAIR